ncbi:phosphatidate cytidylyltransferase [Gorgonomyces haynaldii]|nr:phosphatidate cytidylyltransferase [Gorgonomyces haynaldii]
MVIMFVAILALGPVAVIMLVAFIQALVYREVISIGIIGSKELKLPWFRSLHWYFLLSTNYFLYGESIIYFYKPYVFVDAFLTPLATHHRFISFSLYIIGFVFFVIKLKKGYYKFQFAQFSWTHMALLLVVFQSHFIINNVFEGLIWFVLPLSMVIMNDVMAYFFGFFFGRTPLITLSPKKTWEGFIGGFASTMVFGFFFSAYLLSFPQLITSLRCQTTGSRCGTHPALLLTTYALPPTVTGFIRLLTQLLSLVPYLGIQPLVMRTIQLYPLQLHSLVLAAFASLIAPFGGFFASGVKRAFKIKDFSDSIPGHGGLTDRMDCQFIMGVFSYMYFTTFLSIGSPSTVGSVLQTIVAMKESQILEVYMKLGEYLRGQGIIE